MRYPKRVENFSPRFELVSPDTGLKVMSRRSRGWRPHSNILQRAFYSRISIEMRPSIVRVMRTSSDF